MWAIISESSALPKIWSLPMLNELGQKGQLSVL
jgi:hypothetical protein